MTDRAKGKVAFITGAARGQGRSHAVRLAEEGADIIAIDLCAQIDTVHYQMASQQDLDQTVEAVKAVGGRIVASAADVRDYEAVKAAVDAGVGHFGRLDIVCANAGIVGYSRGHEIPAKDWRDVIDTNLTGAWHTAKAAIPHMIEGGHGGSIIITSSASGIHAYENLAHYVTSKHGQVGLMRTLALELGKHYIRVNTIHPCAVNTDMIHNRSTYEVSVPDVDQPTADDLAERFRLMQAIPIPWVEAIDISNAVLFLASDESRYITGITLPVDAGLVVK
jgi:(+)-trans-carveol dehydrogenase